CGAVPSTSLALCGRSNLSSCLNLASEAFVVRRATLPVLRFASGACFPCAPNLDPQTRSLLRRCPRRGRREGDEYSAAGVGALTRYTGRIVAAMRLRRHPCHAARRQFFPLPGLSGFCLSFCCSLTFWPWFLSDVTLSAGLLCPFFQCSCLSWP